MTKYAAQRIHAKLRAKQRYGVELTSDDLSRIENKIRSGEAEFCRKQSHTRTYAVVVYSGIRFYLIYDRSRGQISTFLSPDHKVWAKDGRLVNWDIDKYLKTP